MCGVHVGIWPLSECIPMLHAVGTMMATWPLEQFPRSSSWPSVNKLSR